VARKRGRREAKVEILRTQIDFVAFILQCGGSVFDIVNRIKILRIGPTQVLVRPRAN
jgi:hypothetical protein